MAEIERSLLGEVEDTMGCVRRYLSCTLAFERGWMKWLGLQNRQNKMGRMLIYLVVASFEFRPGRFVFSLAHFLLSSASAASMMSFA